MLRIRETPEFATLMSCNGLSQPRCLRWHGWLPQLTPRRVDPPWAVSISDTVDACLETALGSYLVDPGSDWDPGWDRDDILDTFGQVLGQPSIWTYGSWR